MCLCVGVATLEKFYGHSYPPPLTDTCFQECSFFVFLLASCKVISGNLYCKSTLSLATTPFFAERVSFVPHTQA